VVVTGYPVLSDLSNWEPADAYRFFGFSADLPVLLVTGGSLGSLSINRVLTAALRDLLPEMQIIHLVGAHTWEQFKTAGDDLPPELAARYRAFPYLHEMGAALRIADLIVSRAGASSLGEYPHFGIPAILVPYPHAWRYQKVNADYLESQGAATTLADEHLPGQLASLVLDLMRDRPRLEAMRQAMRTLARPDAATQIADQIATLASSGRK
jgi:UDP-N-acetylglucosamine--N-acetylmuramyl-(pentapeptide) pyrophosphoryl-undecaprenol N-acetylglucosamine transferase